MKNRAWRVLEPAARGDTLSKVVDLTIVSLILFSVIEMILESEASIRAGSPRFFDWSERTVVAIFLAEYVLRVWSCTSDSRYREPVRGRLRYMCTAGAVIDLLAVAPGLMPLISLDLRFIRIFRVFRVFRVFKLGRYSRAFEIVLNVFRETREELFVSLSFVGALLLVAACLMHYAEGTAQPDHFGSIPDAMWWAIVTLTTVGYGDVYPVTLVGRIIAGLIAVLAIGLVGLPTGILGAGFVEEMRNRRESRNDLHQADEPAR